MVNFCLILGLCIEQRNGCEFVPLWVVNGFVFFASGLLATVGLLGLPALRVFIF